MEQIESLEEGLDRQYQFIETIVLENNHYDNEADDDDEEDEDDEEGYDDENPIAKASIQQKNQLDLISEQQQHSDLSSEQDLSSQQEQSNDSSQSSQSSSQESQNQSQTFKKEFLDELILQIDEFQKLYFLSMEYNGQTQKFYTTKSWQKMLNQIINSSKNSKKRSFTQKKSMKKGKKTPQIYHPDIGQIKRLYFELKRLHLFSLLKNTFILQHYEPRKCSKSNFLEQVDLLLEAHRMKLSSKSQSSKQKRLNKTNNCVRKIYIKRKTSSITLENYFDLTHEQSESEQEYQLIEIQEISFNFNEKNPFKTRYDSSLSTTIDFDPIEQQNEQ